MKVLTEMELRAKWKTPEDGVYHVEAGTFVTPMAKDFLREKGVSMVIDTEEKKSMSRTPVKKQGDHTIIDGKNRRGIPGETGEHDSSSRESSCDEDPSPDRFPGKGGYDPGESPSSDGGVPE